MRYEGNCPVFKKMVYGMVYSACNLFWVIKFELCILFSDEKIKDKDK